MIEWVAAAEEEEGGEEMNGYYERRHECMCNDIFLREKCGLGFYCFWFSSFVIQSERFEVY